jgi:guanylate kinase
MRNLFLVDGAAGTGKSDLLEYIDLKYAAGGEAYVIRKYTTRPVRREEKGQPGDLILTTATDFDERQKDRAFFYYRYGEHRYGFYVTDVEKAIREHLYVFIIIRDMTTIKRLREHCRATRVIPVFIYSDETEIRKRLGAEGYSRAAVDFRLSRQRIAWDDYLAHSDIYEAVILNNSNKVDFFRLIDNLVKRYSRPKDNEIEVSRLERFPLVAPLIGFRPKIEAHLGTYERNVFVMMKYRPSNEETYTFIAEILRAHDFVPVRADQPEWQITGDTYNPVAVLYCCKYGLALYDEAEPNNAFSPNVTYELGMMHLQLKECLILRHTGLPETPFDLIHKLHKPYTKEIELRKLIARWAEEVKHQRSLLLGTA